MSNTVVKSQMPVYGVRVTEQFFSWGDGLWRQWKCKGTRAIIAYDSSRKETKATPWLVTGWRKIYCIFQKQGLFCPRCMYRLRWKGWSRQKITALPPCLSEYKMGQRKITNVFRVTVRNRNSKMLKETWSLHETASTRTDFECHRQDEVWTSPFRLNKGHRNLEAVVT